MRYLIIADMHGNSDALEAVLSHARQQGFEEVLVLGDLVGYGASPNEIVDRVRGLRDEPWVIRGNHDKVVAGIDSGLNFNPTALRAARWTAEQLTPQNLEFIRELPAGPVQVAEGLAICHGSPLDEDEYLLAGIDAQESLEAIDEPLCFFGHTHIPSMFAGREGQVTVSVLEGDELTIELREGTRYLLNPGSVGQPRDRDPRAAYMIFDAAAGRVVLRRVDYAIEQAQERIRRAGLPDILADRLAVGI